MVRGGDEVRVREGEGRGEGREGEREGGEGRREGGKMGQSVYGVISNRKHLLTVSSKFNTHTCQNMT